MAERLLLAADSTRRCNTLALRSLRHVAVANQPWIPPVNGVCWDSGDSGQAASLSVVTP